jgi:hypothetical protein
MELMAVLALGKPADIGKNSTRKDLSEITYSEKYGGKF